MAIVRLRGQLEKLVGASQVTVQGGSVSELLQTLEREHAGLQGWILDERGVLRRHINVFVNGEPAEPDSGIDENDRIEILPAISGG